MDARYVKVQDKPGLVKDERTGALLNTDISALDAYKKRRDAIADQQKRIEKVEEDLSEIKGLLHELLGKLK